MVPSQPEPTAGDAQQGPSDSVTDNAVVETHLVPSQLPIDHCVDLYAVGRNDSELITRPFIHAVELKGAKGTVTNVDGLFDEGALVNSICNQIFPSLQCTLGALTPSLKILRMADGRRISSDGRWCGDVTLGG